MVPRILLAAGGAAFLYSPVLAQGFSGAELSVETFAFTDDFDIGHTSYSGGAEYALSRSFGVAANFSYFGLSALDTDATNLTIHGLYHLGGAATVGLFIGREWTDGVGADIYGLEGGTEFAGGTVEGFVGQIDGTDRDGTMLGLSGRYDFTDAIAATAELGRASLGEETNLTRLSVGGAYALAPGLDLYGNLGQITGESGGADAEETFIGIGARVSFGANRGTTFGARSQYDIIPGF